MVPQMSRILFGDTMVPIIESDYILILGYSILYKECNLTRFNHQKNATQMDLKRILALQPRHFRASLRCEGYLNPKNM